MDFKNKIQNSYKAHVLEEGQRPSSFEGFCDSEAVSGRDVGEYYGSFAQIERDILLGTFTSTLERLADSPEYAPYSAREKVLAFFYTWLEELTEIRSFLHAIDTVELPGLRGVGYLKLLESPFKDYIQGILEEGKESGEVASRELLSGRYPAVFWLELRFLLHFWLQDESEDFAQTDAAVEKAVNFSFDLVAPNVLDSGFDLVKFLIKR